MEQVNYINESQYRSIAKSAGPLEFGDPRDTQCLCRNQQGNRKPQRLAIADRADIAFPVQAL